jgi:hypothetical protein
MNSVIEICSDGKIIEVLTGGIVSTGGGGGGGATNLAYTASPTNGIVTSDTGADATIPAGSATNASLMLPADKTKLDSITVDTATVVRKLVRNQTGATIPKGTAVYQLGSSGIVMTVAPADASSEATAAQTLGITQEAIANNTNGYVVAVGLLDGVNTSALTEGQIVWLSETTGQLTTTRPTPPAHGVVCGYCVKQGGGSSGILYVKVDNGLELEELHDVLLTGAVTGNVLAKFADGLWKPLALDKTSVGLGNVDNTSDLNKPISTATQTALNGKENTITAGTTSQYYRGDKTFQTLDKSAVGLSNVDNTSDLNKPISTATQTALNGKENTITAGTTSQYYRGDKTFQTLDKSAVGLSNVDNTSDANKPISTATQTALNAKENTITAGTISQYYRGDKTFQTLDKTAVGLGNVDNTSDANKPVSTATQTALNAKQDTLNSGTNIKTINGQSILGSGNLSISGGSGGATNLGYTASATNGIVTSDTGTSATIPAGSTTNASLMLPADKSKLDGIATGATANSTDAFLLSRANHTGSQAISTVTGLQTALDGKEPSITAGTTAQYYRGDKTFQTLDKAAVGLSNVDNTSDANKPISTATQTALNAKENTITAGTISQYFRGDKTFQTLDKSAVGLSNVDNTSDLNKPISTATQTALNAKQNTITTGTISQYFRGDLSLATLDKTAVGLSNVANVDTTTTANITDSTNKRFITDSQQTVLSNTSGTNTGDNAVNSLYSGLVSNATHTGEVTGATVLTISNSAVTYAKIQNVSATDRLLGRSTAGAGVVEEIVCTSAGRNLIAGADASAQRTTLGLGSASTASSSDFLPTVFTAGTLTYAATTDLDMASLAGGYRTLSLTGNVTFTSSNRASGRQVTIRIVCDATTRNLTFPAGWVFLGTKPTSIAGSKTAVLSLTFFGTADTDCVAAYGVQT